MTGFEIINLTMCFALAIERLLKGILFDVNPLYILMEPDFKNSCKVLYSRKLIPEKVDSNELAKNTNEDVITYRNSLIMAQHFSSTISNNKALLFHIYLKQEM